jgi:hypothetical protein
MFDQGLVAEVARVAAKLTVNRDEQKTGGNMPR